jgi:hypothetical protein
MYNRIKHFVLKDEIIQRPRKILNNIDEQQQQYIILL